MREIAGPGVTILPVTGRFGAPYIASRAAAAIAGHAALDALAEHVLDCDVVYLACFGDPGLAALKEVAPVPVVGMAEAAVEAACRLSRRFAIVTGGGARAPQLCAPLTGPGPPDPPAPTLALGAAGREIPPAPP